MILNFDHDALGSYAISELVQGYMETKPRERVETLRFEGYRRSWIASAMEEFAKFGGLPALRTLEIDLPIPILHCDETDSNDLGPFVSLPTRLVLTTDARAIPAAMAKNLRELFVCSRPGLAHLVRSCPQLEDLTVSLLYPGDHDDVEGLRPQTVRGCKNIRTLTILGHAMTGSIRGLLRELSGLRKLEIRCRYKLQSLKEWEVLAKSLASHSTLTHVNFWNLEIEGNGSQSDLNAEFKRIANMMKEKRVIHSTARYTFWSRTSVRMCLGYHTHGDAIGFGPTITSIGYDPMTLYGTDPMIHSLLPLLDDPPLHSVQYVHYEEQSDPDFDREDLYQELTELPDLETIIDAGYSPRIQGLLLQRLPDAASRGLREVRVHVTDSFTTERLGPVFASIAKIKSLEKVVIMFHGDDVMTYNFWHLREVVRDYLLSRRIIRNFRALWTNGIYDRPIREIQEDYDESLEIARKLHAFATGLHTRLGHGSTLAGVPSDIVRRIGIMFSSQ